MVSEMELFVYGSSHKKVIIIWCEFGGMGQSWDIRRPLQSPLMIVSSRGFVWLSWLNSGKSLFNLGLEQFCLKCGGVFNQVVALIYAWKTVKM